jgi:cytochrome bd-type quinol oxidase subunit 1
MPNLIVPFTAFTLLYVFLTVVVVAVMRRQLAASPHLEAPEVTP